jgi:hypothetical protein
VPQQDNLWYSSAPRRGTCPWSSCLGCVADSPDYQATKIDYLEATVHHLAVLAIAQSRQYEDLAEEVTELRARVNALRPMVH